MTRAAGPVATTLTLALLAALGASLAGGARRGARFIDDFAHPNDPGGLITNEHALFDPADPDSVRSHPWQMTSGSLFSRDGVGWTGIPDLTTPNARSTNGTGSAIFRLRTRRRDFGNVVVRLRARVLRWTRDRPEQIPSLVLWARYASEKSLYWSSMLRADAKTDVEKKVPGGPDEVNGGTYYILPPYTSSARWKVRLRRWYVVGIRVCNRPDGGVAITTTRNGRVMQRAVDRGVGHEVQSASSGDFIADPAAALRTPGRLGIRSDNAEVEFGRYTVRPAGRPCSADGPGGSR